MDSHDWDAIGPPSMSSLRKLLRSKRNSTAGDQPDESPSSTKAHKTSNSLDLFPFFPQNLSHSIKMEQLCGIRHDPIARIPSEDEASETYRELLSRPTLIATSRLEPWPYDNWDLSLRTGQHHYRLAELWLNSPLIEHITTNLKIPWNSIDLLGYSAKLRNWAEPTPDTPSYPTVLLISVDRDASISQDDARMAIHDCLRVLMNFEIQFVEVDIKTDSPSESSSNNDLPDLNRSPSHDDLNRSPMIFSNSIQDPEQVDFSDYLGAEIGNKMSFSWGTSCLYMKIIKSPEQEQDPTTPEFVQLTCRHVAIPRNFPNEDHLPGNPKEHIMQQPPYDKLEKLHSDAKDRLADWVDEKKKIEFKLIKLYAEPEDKASQINKNEFASEYWGKQINDLKLSYEELRGRFENSQDIDYGKVFCAPKIGPILEKNGKVFIRDWALISINKAKYDSWPPKSRVFIPPVFDQIEKSYSSGLLHSELSELRSFFIGALRTDNQIVLDEFIKDKEIQRTLNEKRHREFRLPVLKYGPKTGFSIGFCNGYKTVKRAPLGDKPAQFALEYCIIGYYNSAVGPNAFSEPRDSGACVFAPDGRILGMLTSGYKGKSDTTYMTSIETIMDDAERFGIETRPV